MDIKVKLNARGALMYEMMTGKSYYGGIADEDYPKLAYCIYMGSGNPPVTYPVFLHLCQNKKFLEKMEEGMTEAADILDTFRYKGKEDGAEETNEEDKKGLSITDIIEVLIIDAGMDAHYVLDEMGLWEISLYIDAFNEKRKAELFWDREWTYLNVLSHLTQEGAKKLKTPDKLIQFPWERKKKKTTLNDEEQEALKKFLQSQPKITGDKEDNG